MFAKMGHATRPGRPEFLSSHPSAETRVSDTKELIAAVKAYQKCCLTTLEFIGKAAGAERYVVGCHDKSRHAVSCDLEKCRGQVLP